MDFARHKNGEENTCKYCSVCCGGVDFCNRICILSQAYKVTDCNITLVGESGVYSFASELSYLKGIELTATTDYERPSELSGNFQVICDDVAQSFTWTVEKSTVLSTACMKLLLRVIILSDRKEIKLVLKNGSKTNVLNIIGIEFVGVDEP